MDAESYGRRVDWAQEELQQLLVRLFVRAAKAAGLDRATWMTQATGDGELALVPLGRDEPRVADDYVRHLDAELDRLNRRRVDGDRVRLRVAIAEGAAYPGANGYAGQGVVAVARLLNSTPLRRALAAAPQANLALALSDGVFQALVLGDHTSYVEGDFHRAQVVEKEYRASAWVRVPGVDVHRLDLAGDDADAAPGQAQQGQGPTDEPVGRAAAGAPGPRPQRHEADVMNVFHGGVDARHATFGFSGGSRG
ncbi:hypothetical protein ACIBJE_18705 [Micromonospora sp. NPDC050187]|uniref:hypothetical protein n=1 Tax=Micromonospora sp. NPDC050187 TaxID=3364277 RepID=UPI00379F2833